VQRVLKAKIESITAAEGHGSGCPKTLIGHRLVIRGDATKSLQSRLAGDSRKIAVIEVYFA
jgi:hypothetical protein